MTRKLGVVIRTGSDMEESRSLEFLKTLGLKMISLHGFLIICVESR